MVEEQHYSMMAGVFRVREGSGRASGASAASVGEIDGANGVEA
jgi:hypothetical protein